MTASRSFDQLRENRFSAGDPSRARVSGRDAADDFESSVHHGAIVGLERRLNERRLNDPTYEPGVVRMALTRHYAAFALDMVRRAGGDVRALKALTDRNNIIPLAGKSNGSAHDD